MDIRWRDGAGGDDGIRGTSTSLCENTWLIFSTILTASMALVTDAVITLFRVVTVRARKEDPYRIRRDVPLRPGHYEKVDAILNLFLIAYAF
jgi:hypothetical protein